LASCALNIVTAHSGDAPLGGEYLDDDRVSAEVKALDRGLTSIKEGVEAAGHEPEAQKV
jgi:hypothetical protein